MEALVSKGFLVFAQNTKDVDYVKQAYALALSIKKSQKEVTSISLVTNDSVPKKYQDVFDNIIPIPWYTETETGPLVAEHRWKLYHASPYEETIVLDSDMLILEDLSLWWRYCGDYDIKFCSTIKNYKMEQIVDTSHRKTFIANNLQGPYFAFHYFKKCQRAHDFYKVLEFVINNWEWCHDTFAPALYQEWCSMDLSAAIAIEISGMYDVIDNCNILDIIHMKVPLQGWPVFTLKWQDAVPVVLNKKGELFVGNIKQTKVFHYVEKDFITKSMLKRLEENVYGTK